MKKIIFLLILVVTLMLVGGSAFALDRGLEASQLRPAADNGSYFGVWDSKTMYKFEWRAGTFFTYEYRPLQLTAGGARVQGIIDNTLIQHLYGSFGIFDKWLSIGFDLPVGWWVDFRNPNVAGSTSGNNMALGDLRINFKSCLYQSRCKRFGVALVPFIDIPTGYGSTFFGNGTVNGGGFLVLDARPFKRFKFSLNAGVSGRSTYNFRNIERRIQLLLGLGASYRVSRNVSLNAEIHSQARLTGIYQEVVESPTEILTGVKWKLGQTGLVASFGGGMGITHGSMSPQVRLFTGLSYTPIKRKIRKLKRALRKTDVYFDTGKSEIKEQEASKLSALTTLLKKTYGYPIKINGHTDNEGEADQNDVLSLNRALAVKDYFVGQKIKAKRLFVEGFGEASPTCANKTEADKAKNRRVEFKRVSCKRK